MVLNLRYQIQSIRVRGPRTLLTIVGTGLVVAVFCYLLCLADGLRRALARSGDPRNVVVLAEAATAESNSAVFHDDVHKLEGIPQVERDPSGRALVSPEVVVQINVTRQHDPGGAEASVVVRGVDPDVALQVRPNVALRDGRWFAPGTDELVVGRAATQQFNQMNLGATIACGDRMFTVVGIFEASGGVHESELWGYAPNVEAAFRRAAYSSATLRVPSAAAATVAGACERIAAAGIALRGVPEPAYFATQAGNARMLEGLALALVIVMGAAAGLAALNTMHAAVAGRTREIGMLRAIGFSRSRIVLGILAESLVIALAGGVLGCLACGLVILLDHGAKDLVGTATFTSVAFTLGLSAANVALSLSVAGVIGVLGGLWPARTAGRLAVVEALRSV